MPSRVGLALGGNLSTFFLRRIRAVSMIALMSLVILAPANTAANSVFQSGPPTGHSFAIFPFWQQVLTDMATAEAHAHFAFARSCDAERTCIPAAWTIFLDSIRKLSQHEQMDAVNNWANAKPYVEDSVNWHVADYWETPGEFIAHGGDCEDYAITKYFSLTRLGFSPSDLRIVIVDDLNLKAFHAVLAVRNGRGVWLLDDQLPQIVRMDVAVQYIPIYSLNELGWWLHSTPKVTTGNLTAAGKLAATHRQLPMIPPPCRKA
jgi:predicted transglutaminase-like cysteine proteinase